MMGVKKLLLVSLLALLEVAAASGYHGRCMPGAPCNVSRNDASLQQVVLNATYCYNNQSNDAFLFKPSNILRAQRQVVKGVRYTVDFEISRTVCHKRDNNNNLSSCDFQPQGPLFQTFRCHYVVWLIPWENFTKTEGLSCKP